MGAPGVSGKEWPGLTCDVTDSPYDDRQKWGEGKEAGRRLAIVHLPVMKAWIRGGAVEVLRRSEVPSLFWRQTKIWLWSQGERGVKGEHGTGDMSSWKLELPLTEAGRALGFGRAGLSGGYQELCQDLVSHAQVFFDLGLSLGITPVSASQGFFFLMIKWHLHTYLYYIWDFIYIRCIKIYKWQIKLDCIYNI